MLDSEQGGFFQLVPDTDFRVDRQYVDQTNVLETTFQTDSGTLRLTDWIPAACPLLPETYWSTSLIRRVECIAGQVSLRVHFRPSFDYARKSVSFRF
ncbi:glycosyl hydrolase family protein, partial [Rhodopirellula maiorica SM1]